MFALTQSRVEILSWPRSGPGLAFLVGHKIHAPIAVVTICLISTTPSCGFLMIYEHGGGRDRYST